MNKWGRKDTCMLTSEHVGGAFAIDPPSAQNERRHGCMEAATPCSNCSPVVRLRHDAVSMNGCVPTGQCLHSGRALLYQIREGVTRTHQCKAQAATQSTSSLCRARHPCKARHLCKARQPHATRITQYPPFRRRITRRWRHRSYCRCPRCTRSSAGASGSNAASIPPDRSR